MTGRPPITGIVAADPGGRDTGIVSMIISAGGAAPELYDAQTITRTPGEHATDYAVRAADRTRSVGGRLARELARRNLDARAGLVLAIEDVIPPSWYQGGKARPINPAGLIDTAIVLGSVRLAMQATSTRVMIVTPGRNGSNVLIEYPDALVSDAERRRPGWQLNVGKGQLRHQRSAWDVGRAVLDPLYDDPTLNVPE